MKAHVHAIYIFAIVLLVAAALIGAREWANHVRADATADADVKQKAEQIKDLTAKADAAKADAQVVRDTLAKNLDDLKKRPQTAPQVIHDVIPWTRPPEIDIPLPPGAIPSTAPDTPAPNIKRGDMVLDQQQQQDLAMYARKCDACGAEKALLQEQLDAKDGVIQKQTGQITDLKNKSAGGKWYQRAWGKGKLIICGSAGAGLGATGGAKGAVIGAAAGGLACELLGGRN